MLKACHCSCPAIPHSLVAATTALRAPSTSRTTAFTPNKSRTMTTEVCASNGNGSLAQLDSYNQPAVKKRDVIEHLAVFQMKKDFTDELEKDMLDHLYTLQYHLKGIVALSVGTISTQSAESDGCTHALFTRFPSMEALTSYYDSAPRAQIYNDHIIPYCNELICVDYKAQVEDDILPIFRRGDAFEQGVEHLMLLKAKDGVDPVLVEESLHELSQVYVDELGELVVQHTSGANFCHLSKGYTHGMVTRYPSVDAKDFCTGHPSYINIMEQKFRPVLDCILSLEYHVVPPGTSL